MRNYPASISIITIESEMYHNSVPVLHYTIQYPQFMNRYHQKALNRINTYYKKMALEYQLQFETVMYCEAVNQYEYSIANDFPFHMYEALLNFQVTYNKDCVISLFFDIYRFTGGAHGNTIRFADTWNIENGYRIPLSQLFIPSLDYKEWLITMITKQIAYQMSQGENWYFEEYESLVRQYFNCNNFYLSPEGVMIFFQQYEIAPYASGIPVFTIPFDENCVSRPFCCRCW
ncbi:DUF3298 and DUF4163 domain-containing protein [Sinanaerobacter chloroacetimidivorans]|uniref:DUF3298 and DUF4163 domain-containing protein n=1 Tax=Sinanaerobacter chloroacetimidivorans TaxID=2818044 RepID=A0A8J7VZ46_9FIRM|nr:DUF3298 and DUF4163 domain-containing protein [Sinanaerobacter chloroacetimidivorans]MBR0596668.1 DUF3298 and DUF4163 domain-containing protein [Sinanaerobacter chloroacetimidivorans]